MEAAFLAERDVNDPYFPPPLPLHLPLNRNGEDGEISRVNRLIAEIYFYPLTDPMLTEGRSATKRLSSRINVSPARESGPLLTGAINLQRNTFVSRFSQPTRMYRWNNQL